MSGSKPLFRQAALDRLASPDQLDQLVCVTSPLGWLALAALGVLCLAVLGWACLGEVPTRVTGQGILVAQGGGVVDAITPAQGVLSALIVRPGSRVAKGDAIADLVQPAARQTLEHARDAVRDLRAEHARLEARLGDMTRQRREALARERLRIGAVALAAQQRADYNNQELADLAQPASRSNVTRQRVQDIRQAMQEAEQELLRVRQQLARLDTEELDATDRREEQLAQSRMRVADAERHLGELEDSYAATSRVLAPAAGEVIEIKGVEGTFVAAGTPVVGLQTGSGTLQAVLFIPPEHGKDVHPGMPVQIEPATARRTEFGTLTGRVASVSEFPATARGMNAVLQNDELVRQFSRTGPPYTALVMLATDARGYVWSSGAPPSLTVTSGTLATADITVRRQRPITLVLPFLGDVLGGDVLGGGRP